MMIQRSEQAVFRLKYGILCEAVVYTCNLSTLETGAEEL